jgi:transposase-like protein
MANRRKPYVKPVRPAMTLPELIDQFGDEDRCREYLENVRWPDGVQCPRCESKKISRIVKRNQFDCDSCRYQFSVRTGTIFHDSKLPFRKWFLAVFLMCESRKGISANQMKRMLKVHPKTAWYLCHRIRAAMHDASPEPLSGIVEVDETYIGGKARGKGKGYKKNKTMILGAVERGGRVRLQVAPNEKRETLRGFAKSAISDDAEAIYTDQEPAYGDLNDWNTRHERVNHGDEEWVRGLIHTNTVESVWSLFDRGVIGSYHKLSVKHLPAYLDEFTFRFNNRENPFLFRDTVLALISAKALPYRSLVEPR